MVTLPSEAATDPSLVAECVAAGMDIARINCAHDDTAAWAGDGRQRARGRRRGRPHGPGLDGRARPEAADRADQTGPRGGARPGDPRRRRRHVCAPARIWLTDAAAPTEPPEPAPPREAADPAGAGRDAAWLGRARGRGRGAAGRCPGPQPRRSPWRRSMPRASWPRASRNAYIADGSKLWCRDAAAVVRGIPPLPQRLSLTDGDTLVLTEDLDPGRPARSGRGRDHRVHAA